MAVKLIVGLGNPGSRYQGTRHNAGFMVLDRLAEIAAIPVNRKGFSGSYGEGNWQSNRVLLLKPQTFMNLSGRSVAAALRFYKLDLADLIVIHDDLDIPYGRVKVKENGGHGGHNGLRSLIAELGSGEFVRVRIGIGRPVQGEVVDFVLTKFERDELITVPHLLDTTVALLGLLLKEGVAKAMSLFNNRDMLS